MDDIESLTDLDGPLKLFVIDKETLTSLLTAWGARLHFTYEGLPIGATLHGLKYHEASEQYIALVAHASFPHVTADDIAELEPLPLRIVPVILPLAQSEALIAGIRRAGNVSRSVSALVSSTGTPLTSA